MKKPFPWSSLLLTILGLSLLGNVALCYQYVKLASLSRRGTVEMRGLQEKVNAAQRDRAVLQAMAIESLKYARHHPAMLQALTPFLPAFKGLGINVTSNTAPPAAPQP